MVRIHELSELYEFLFIEVILVLQQQLAAVFEGSSSWLVLSQLVGLVDSDAVNDFPAILGNDMEQIVDNLCVGAVFFDFRIKSGVLVHRDGFDLLAIPTEALEERTYRFSASAFTDPEHLLGVCIRNY